MKKYLLVICDLDVNYAEGLLAHFSQKNDNPFEVKQITELESLNSIQEEVELLLLDENLKGIQINGNVKRVLYLSEGIQDQQHVNRYQPVDEIILHISSICDMSSEISIKEISKTAIIGIYSPVGGCGKTAFAREFAEFVSSRGGQVFYFDFELVSNEPCAESADFFYDMHERILFEEENWNNYFVLRDGVYCLKTSYYNCQLWNMSTDDMNYLIQGISKHNESAYYILDIGFINEAVICMLNQCDCWIMPYRDEEGRQGKIQNLKGLLEFCGEEKLIQKRIEVDMGKPYHTLFEKLVS